MGKKLNITSIENELTGASAFFARSNVQDTNNKTVNGSTNSVSNIPVNGLKKALHSSEEAKNEVVNKNTERNNRTVGANDRTIKELKNTSLLDDITKGVKTEKRSTERYSFEIYSDQIPRIEELQYLYKRRTGQKLSSSRIMREALEAYLHDVFEALKKK